MKHDELADALAVLRIRAGLTQPALAEKLGLQVNLLQKIESGEREPSFALMADWARLCGSELDVRFRHPGQEDSEDAAGQLARLILALPGDDQQLLRTLVSNLGGSSTGWRDILKEQLNFRSDTRSSPGSSTPAPSSQRATPTPAPSGRAATASPSPRTPQGGGGRTGTPAPTARAMRNPTPAPGSGGYTPPATSKSTPAPNTGNVNTGKHVPRRGTTPPVPLTLPSTFPNLRSTESVSDDGTHVPSDNELAEREMGDRLRAVARQNVDDLPAPVEPSGFAEVLAVLKRTLRSRFPWLFGSS